MTQAIAARLDRELYNDEIASEILDRLANGETLTNICKDDHLPSRITVWRWTQGRNGARDEFRGGYLEARSAQADMYFDKILAVAQKTMDRPSNHRTNANRLYVDTVKWSLAKMRPNVYGDLARLHVGPDQELPKAKAVDMKMVLSGLDENEKAQLRKLARKVVTGGGRKLALPAPSSAEPNH